MPVYQTNKLMGEILEYAVAQNTNLEAPPFGTMFADAEFLSKLKGKGLSKKIQVVQRYPHRFDAFKLQPWCPKWKGTLVITGETEVEALLRCWLYAVVGESISLDVPFEHVTHYEMRVFKDGIQQGEPVKIPFTIAQTNGFGYIMHDQGVLLQDAYEICRAASREGRRGQPTYQFKPVVNLNVQLPIEMLST